MKPDSWVSGDSSFAPNLTDQFRGSPSGGIPSSNDDSALGSSCQNLGFVGSNGSSASSVPQSNHFNPVFGSAPAASFLASALESASANQYEKWSSGLDLGLMNSAAGLDLGSLTNATSDLDEKLQNVQLYPPRSQIKRQKMIYHCRFGEFGVIFLLSCFREFIGVCKNLILCGLFVCVFTEIVDTIKHFITKVHEYTKSINMHTAIIQSFIIQFFPGPRGAIH